MKKAKMKESKRRSEKVFIEYRNTALKLRCSPSSFMTTIKKLTDAQVSDVKNMGFGSILSLDIDNISTGLAYWLLVNYDEETHMLNMGNHKLKITASKVHEIFGIPMGKLKVLEKNRPRKGAHSTIDEFRNQFEVSRISPSKITPIVEEHQQNGGRLFKLNFLVLWNTIFGEITKSTTVNQRFLLGIDDEAEIPEMDWCSYMIECLKRTKEGWKGDDDQYNGPIALLVVLYTHEYNKRHKIFKEPIKTPAISYITSSTLFDMQTFLFDNGPLTDDEVEEDANPPVSQKNKDKIGYNMGRTRKCAWRNTEAPKKKLKQTQKLLYDDDGDEEPLVQSRGPQAKFQSAAEGQTDEVQAQTVEDQANEGQTTVEQTNSDVGLDQNSIKKCISPPSAQSLSGFTAYLGYCNHPGSPRNEKVLAEASKKIFSSVTSKAVDIITDQKEIDTGDSGEEMNVIDDDSPEWAQALEPVRKLPTNVGARIRRCIYESLNRNPPEWAREILEHSISKEVYKGNALAPKKRAVISVLQKVRVDIPQPKPTEKKEKEKEKSGIGYNMGRTKERAWRNTNTHTQKKKLKPTRKLLDDDDDEEEEDGKDDDDEEEEEEDEEDDDDDVVILDPKKEQCELSEHVSPMSDSLLDDDIELLTSKQEHCELVENLSSMSDSVEKYSSCQSGIVCVQGYKVKRSIATILEAIFKKHGDIAANCVFKTSSTRTHFLEVVCELVRRIQTNDMTEMVEDIECQVSDAEAANINVSWIRAYFEAFHKRKETNKRYSLLMEMKSNTSLVKRAAQMDLRETCAELMSAQERFKNAERCVRVLHVVEKNLNDIILESKAKLDSWVKHPVV